MLSENIVLFISWWLNWCKEVSNHPNNLVRVQMLSEEKDGEGLLSQQRSLFTRARKLCRDSVTNSPMQRHISALHMIVEEVQEVSELLGTEDVSCQPYSKLCKWNLITLFKSYKSWCGVYLKGDFRSKMRLKRLMFYIIVSSQSKGNKGLWGPIMPCHWCVPMGLREILRKRPSTS